MFNLLFIGKVYSLTEYGKVTAFGRKKKVKNDVLEKALF